MQFLPVFTFAVYGIFAVRASETSREPPDVAETSPSISLEPKGTLVGYATVKEVLRKDDGYFNKRPGNIVQYQIILDNETFTVTLRPNKKLFTSDCLLHYHLPGGKKEIYPCSREQLDCYYTGRSDVHIESWVAANICNGLTGVVSFDNTSLFIEPVNTSSSINSSQGAVHTIHRFQGDKRACPIDAVSSGSSGLHVVHGRQRRTTRTRYINTRLVVDPNMFYSHRGWDHITRYTLMVFNIASKLYSDPSIGTQIQLRLSELFIMETYDIDLNPIEERYVSIVLQRIEHDSVNINYAMSEFASELTENANRTLKTFCEWQSHLTTRADCSVLLTSLNLESDTGERGVNGLSFMGRMCNANLHCGVVQDEGPFMGITLAHEIGHLLGMTHDDNTSLGVGIMSSGGWSGREAFTWSSQSATQLQSSLMSGNMSCLEKRSGNEEYYSVSELSLPGTMYTADRQCKMSFNESYVFYQDESRREDPCKNIICRYSDNVPLKTSSPLMDGTDCNNTRTWCISGQCVPIDQQHYTVSPVDGGWSLWDREYSACSRSCGGGVQIKERHCNNPPPQYGGKKCVGVSSRRRLCNLKACEADYRVQQCSEILKSTDALPDFGYFDAESCTIGCNGMRFLNAWYSAGKYRDGTECLTTTPVPFSRCVGGKCLVFGCDGYLGSGLKYDKCGVCNGTGSTCKEITGTYNKVLSTGEYTNVTVIPAGSSAVYIQQRNRACFLSIIVEGKRTLNTDKVQSETAAFNILGIELRYQKNPETIEIVGKTTKDVILQVIKTPALQNVNRANVSPDITFKYHVRIPELQSYAWAEIPNESCSRSCGTGFKSNSIKCMSVTGQFVDDYFCGIATKPEVTVEKCNKQPCPPRWSTSAWGNCSVSCGKGIKTRLLQCVRLRDGLEQAVPAVRCERLGLQKPRRISPCYNACDWKASTWSECSATCGDGYRRRHVSCIREGEEVEVDTKFCEGEKPTETESCTKGSCDADDVCVDDERCDRISSQYCHSPEYIYWMKRNCPLKCNFICKDCDDNCSRYDTKYCTDKAYMKYMKRNCAKSCGICSDS